MTQMRGAENVVDCLLSVEEPGIYTWSLRARGSESRAVKTPSKFAMFYISEKPTILH
jgi:hypothetical protein